jgi:predicted small lipoprotein YifL
MIRNLSIAVALALVGAVAGCGEKPAVTVFKQGHYQGKPDMRPWDNDQFKGDKLAWEQAIKARNERQDETSRGTPVAKN